MICWYRVSIPTLSTCICANNEAHASIGFKLKAVKFQTIDLENEGQEHRYGLNLAAYVLRWTCIVNKNCF